MELLRGVRTELTVLAGEGPCGDDENHPRLYVVHRASKLSRSGVVVNCIYEGLRAGTDRSVGSAERQSRLKRRLPPGMAALQDGLNLAVWRLLLSGTRQDTSDRHV
jgi:hypothetical protein